MSTHPFYNHLLQQAGSPPESPLGPKPNLATELNCRRMEAKRLTSLIEENSSFSFVRLGDMDLCLLLAEEAGLKEAEDVFDTSKHIAGTQPSGCPGIGPDLAPRLREAIQKASYVDFHERLWPMGALLKNLKIHRPEHLNQNPSPTTSYITLTWMEHEFARYCSNHKVGFCGAEASIAEKLFLDGRFRANATELVSNTCQYYFHQPYANGDNLSSNIDKVKANLKTFIDKSGIDTLFLSLGGAAKILCLELAREENIRCFDFGAMLRGLCYLGSDGNRAARSTHNPFFYRIPFNAVMDAIEAAFPNLKPNELLAKAHAQIILELQKKERFWTSASHEYDFSSLNYMFFRESLKSYHERYKKLFSASEECRLERKRFLHFCGSRRLTISGRIFYGIFQTKSALRQFFIKKNRGEKKTPQQ